MWKHLTFLAGFVMAAAPASQSSAEQRQYCVACKDPDATYLCQVDTPHANPNDKGLQLYCIIRTSKDGGHSSCAVKSGNVDSCAGTLKSYTFAAPAIPPEVRETINRLRKPKETDQTQQDLPPQKGGEPETLIDMTGRAVGASRDGLKNTGQAVGTAAGATTQTVGKAARGVGKGVTKAAGKAGSVTKKTGSAVGNAAKTAYDCLRSLFKECGSSQ